MTKENSGFSFGSAPDRTDDDFVDAIEVSGEPVSRQEASQLGLHYDTPRENREAKASTNIIQADQLPKDISDDLAKKLDQAWTHLKRNEIEEALTLAQEVVWQYPAVVAAKLIIARCFINRKEYEKALNILQAISENEMSAETMYYIGLAQSRLGRVREAIAALNLSRSSASDSITRKRAGELLMNIQGEQATCPICGKKTLYDSMVEVGNRIVCANCAKSLEKGDIAGEDEAEPEEDDYVEIGTKRRKRLRRPLTRLEILLRVLLAVILGALVLVLLYYVFPDYYQMLHSLIPGSSLILPPPAPSRSRQQPAAANPNLPRVVPSMVFTSPPVELAVVGVELRHRLDIEGMRDRRGEYAAAFTPRPAGAHAIDKNTGVMTWTPAPEDAGKTFTLTFSAAFGNMLARDQVNTVRVSRGAAVEKAGVWPNPAPGALVHILGENVADGPASELFVASGLYWEGAVAIVDPDAPEGGDPVVARANLGGRPAGAGVIVAGGEKWLAVADYWNSRLRYFVYRNGSLSETATSVPLPGRPILAGFAPGGSIAAVLVNTAAGPKLIAYDQSDQINTAVVGEWSVPSDAVWRDIFVFPAPNPRTPAAILLVGGDIERSLLVADNAPDGARELRTGLTGTVVAAARERDRQRFHVILKDGETQILASIDPFAANPVVNRIPAGAAPAVGGLAAASLAGNRAADLVFLTDESVGISFELQDGGRTAPYYWPLPSRPVLFGKPGALAGEHGDRVVYADVEGNLWAAGLGN